MPHYFSKIKPTQKATQMDRKIGVSSPTAEGKIRVRVSQ